MGSASVSYIRTCVKHGKLPTTRSVQNHLIVTDTRSLAGYPSRASIRCTPSGVAKGSGRGGTRGGTRGRTGRNGSYVALREINLQKILKSTVLHGYPDPVQSHVTTGVHWGGDYVIDMTRYPQSVQSVQKVSDSTTNHHLSISTNY
eukprot:497306-Prorocentrum_minimum.AAC.4